MVQGARKNIESVEQVRVSDEQCRDAESQGAEASSEPGRNAEKMRRKQPSFLRDSDSVAFRFGLSFLGHI